MRPCATSRQKSRWAYLFLVLLVDVFACKMWAFTMYKFTKNHSRYFHALTENLPTLCFALSWSFLSTAFMFLLYRKTFSGWSTWMVSAPCLLLIMTDTSGLEFVLRTWMVYFPARQWQPSFPSGKIGDLHGSYEVVFFFTSPGRPHLFCLIVPLA